MTICELFISTYNDLEHSFKSDDEYTILRASALLRQLLLDSAPLIHLVNAKYRLRLQFTVYGREYRELVLNMNPESFMALDGIYEKIPVAGHRPELLKLDEYLATTVVKFKGKIFTIRDIINHTANVLGGVHFGNPKDEKEEVLSNTNNIMKFSGLPISIRQLKPIIGVTLDGLKELYDKCLNDGDS